MPTDPEHGWNPEPAEQFRFPVDPQVDLLKDYFRQRYGRGLEPADVEWLGKLVFDFSGPVAKQLR